MYDVSDGYCGGSSYEYGVIEEATSASGESGWAAGWAK